jgi:hypothetical protein
VVDCNVENSVVDCDVDYHVVDSDVENNVVDFNPYITRGIPRRVHTLDGVFSFKIRARMSNYFNSSYLIYKRLLAHGQVHAQRY